MEKLETIELGGARLHVLTAWPGLPGEGDRISRAIGQLDPAIILADIDTAGALRLREAGARGAFAPATVDKLFADESIRRFAPDTRNPGEHPLLAAQRVARNRKLTLMPLRPSAKEPGFFGRRKAARLARDIAAIPQEQFPEAFSAALKVGRLLDAAADADAAQPRVAQALAEGRAPVLAILQPHRAAPFLGLVRGARKVSA